MIVCAVVVCACGSKPQPTEESKTLPVSSVALKGNEIDDLLVKKAYQGKGYGKQILLWALENINSDTVILHVAEWNQRALNLYKSVGFEVTKTIEIR